jgi:hypothetical protein
MKKLTSLVLAVVSTMFLFAGATHAAEKLDPLAHESMPAVSDTTPPQLSGPCGSIDPE